MPSSLRFYIDQIGFEMVSHSPSLGGDLYRYHWVWIRLGGSADLMLNSCYEFDNERPTREQHMLERRHRDTCLFFGCPDVDGAYRELTERGVVIDRPPKIAPYGMRQMYLKDPDGFGLCFQWKAE